MNEIQNINKTKIVKEVKKRIRRLQRQGSRKFESFVKTNNNIHPWSVISNESSFGKIGHVEQENKQILYSFKSVPDIAREYSSSLYKLLPRIKLTDLLMEVASWKGFENQFIHASTLHPPKEEEKPASITAIMAMGTNIGLMKMAEATQEVTYRQMFTAQQWHLYEDSMNKAQATLVNFQHQLSLPSYWGDGITSSPQ